MKDLLAPAEGELAPGVEHAPNELRWLGDVLGDKRARELNFRQGRARRGAVDRDLDGFGASRRE